MDFRGDFTGERDAGRVVEVGPDRLNGAMGDFIPAAVDRGEAGDGRRDAVFERNHAEIAGNGEAVFPDRAQHLPGRVLGNREKPGERRLRVGVEIGRKELIAFRRRVFAGCPDSAVPRGAGRLPRISGSR